MWRSNVPRVTKWSSTGRFNHGVISRWYSSEKSWPITELEFDSALRHVLRFRKGTDNWTRPLGFAVSGGVDSMALVSLYARARHTHVHLPKAHGFIVDHQVRPESTQEAEWVAEQLRYRYNMATSILTLTWPNQFDMLDTKRFETDARALRYQALGRACREHGIDSLMVAHHADDQAETVMMRLAKNRFRTGLRGMQSTEWIPECEGIYGVYHSGQDQTGILPPNLPFRVERGGIRILRPLLAMEKSRLIATCEERGVKWAEDKSNRIQSLTSRNAIRHIYQNHKLPEALSIKSLVNLSLHMQKRIEAHKAYADSLYDQCLLKLDIREGTLIVRFPPFSKLLARPIATEADKNEARNNVTYLLGKVVELVTPCSKPALGQIAERIDDIYPEFLSAEERDAISSAGEGHLRQNFTVCHVWWRRCDKASPFEDDALPADDFGASAPHPQEWLLTRQSLHLGEPNTLQLETPPYLPGSGSEYPEFKEKYKLFDGRYWIKLRNYTKDTLVLRPFRKADMQDLCITPIKKGGSVFNPKPGGYLPERFVLAALALIKPTDVRYTLPAVFRRDNTGKHSLVGFPTLNVTMDGFGPPRGVCHWRVRYKKIECGQRTAEDIIVPGRDKLEIIKEESRLRHINKGVLYLNLGKHTAGEEKAGAGT